MVEQNNDTFSVNGIRLTLRNSIEIDKGKNNWKLGLKENEVPHLNRRSYNEHMGSENFINLLDDDRASGRERHEADNKSRDAVFGVLHAGGDDPGLHINEKRCFCLPSRQLAQKGATSPGQRPMDVVSQSEFASQTLKQFSTQHLEWTAFDELELRNGDAKYMLKEASPGCLPSIGKTKKLQRRSSGRTSCSDSEKSPNENAYGYSSDDEARLQEDKPETADDGYNSEIKAPRRKSFLSSLKFIGLGMFGKRKKGKDDFYGQNSSWVSESVERRHKTGASYEADDFIFGGVRVFIDENGNCYEVDEEFDTQASSDSAYSEDDTQAWSTRRGARTKFESQDSLNLGYSGSFVT